VKCLTLFALLGFSLGTSAPTHKFVRCTGRTGALHSFLVKVPRQYGMGGQLTLLQLVENGAPVKANELLAEFDSTDQLKLARDAAAKFDDLSHQVEMKRAEQADAREKRRSDLIQAQADLEKAEIDIKKGPVLSDIDQQKNAVKLEDARTHVASLQRSSRFHEQAEAADMRILELQRDRQKRAVEHQQANAALLLVRSPFAGMAALENVWRNNSMGHAQAGDRLYPGQSLVRVFDPSTMIVIVAVGEPDGAILKPGCKAAIHLDAFPDVAFTAHFDSASPVATSAVDTSIKTFSALFILDQTDPRLLPDLSVAADIELQD
jgi:multidrug resistance efflux pump